MCCARRLYIPFCLVIKQIETQRIIENLSSYMMITVHCSIAKFNGCAFSFYNVYITYTVSYLIAQCTETVSTPVLSSSHYFDCRRFTTLQLSGTLAAGIDSLIGLTLLYENVLLQFQTSMRIQLDQEFIGFNFELPVCGIFLSSDTSSHFLRMNFTTSSFCQANCGCS